MISNLFHGTCVGRFDALQELVTVKFHFHTIISELKTGA